MSLEDKNQLNKKIQEKKVVVSELKSLRKGVRVYKQQQNSNIFFKADKKKCLKRQKALGADPEIFTSDKRKDRFLGPGALDDLVLQYQELEESKSAEGEGAESGEEEEESEDKPHPLA